MCRSWALQPPFSDTVRMQFLRSLGRALNKRRGAVAFAIILVWAFAWLIVATMVNIAAFDWKAGSNARVWGDFEFIDADPDRPVWHASADRHVGHVDWQRQALFWRRYSAFPGRRAQHCPHGQEITNDSLGAGRPTHTACARTSRLPRPVPLFTSPSRSVGTQ